MVMEDILKKKYKVSNRFESEYELIMKMRDKIIECALT